MLVLFKPAVLKQNRQEEKDNAHYQHKKTVSANQVELEWVLVAGRRRAVRKSGQTRLPLQVHLKISSAQPHPSPGRVVIKLGCEFVVLCDVFVRRKVHHTWQEGKRRSLKLERGKRTSAKSQSPPTALRTPRLPRPRQ